MLRSNTTLVLGAGASLAMGYPTGAQLRAQIINLAHVDRLEFAITAGLVGGEGPTLREFVDAFQRSQMLSIDAFLAKRTEFTDIGKRAIAALLLDRELPSTLYDCAHPDQWYQYLWNKLGSATWEDLSFSRLRIVTFNYDRSLEHYLLQAIQHSHGKSEREALGKLRTLKIVHVYGSLGATLPTTSTDYLEYGCGIQNGAPSQVASYLQVIPEGREDAESLALAKEHLLWADRIGFLGFGFDPQNMERLDSKTTCKRTVSRPGQISSRPIHATAYGLTEAETEAARNLIGGSETVEPRFYACDCLTMLRQSALLQ